MAVEFRVKGNPGRIDISAAVTVVTEFFSWSTRNSDRRVGRTRKLGCFSLSVKSSANCGCLQAA
jgi:hypothetical protein